MGKYASKVVAQAQAWVGRKESNGTHKEIIDVYNSHKPLARGYKVKYTDAWCSTFASAVAIAVGYTDIIPTECGCEKHTLLFKEKGIWMENENRVPNAGDFIFYDWNDNGVGDNKGSADHVGIVEKVENNTITVIEGNYKNSVGRRTIKVNAKNIRGYGVPKYDAEPTPKEYKPTVLEWQKAAIADGFKFPKAGADGKWGSECRSVVKKTVVKKRLTHKYKNLTKIVQKIVDVEVDGRCGKDTDKAIRVWQKANGLSVDGAFGPACWQKALGV